MNYLSVSQMAKKWNMSERGVRKYCAENKIPGVFLTGKTWNIPENAEKPERKNKKSGEKGMDELVRKNRILCKEPSGSDRHPQSR